MQREAITLFVRQLGRRSRMEQRVEFRRSAEGVPISLDYELVAGTVHTNWRGTFDGMNLQIRPPGTTSASRQKTTVALPDDTRFTRDRSERFIALWKKQQTAIDTLVFDPSRRTSGLIRAKTVADDDAKGTHVRATSGAARNGPAEDIWFDATGRVRRIESDVLGARVVWTPCERDCDAAVVEPMDPMDRLVVRSPVRIPSWFKHRRLRFVIARNDGAPPQLAQTFEQATVLDGPHAVVTICERCGREASPTHDELARYLAPNAWVQSDDPEIRHLALNTVLHGASVDFRMRKLVQLVVRRMRGSSDFLGYADAVTALHASSGDCTEFAVLLAALARAQGIPTRIVAGVAYSDRFSGKKDVFSPHTWVQAWDGKTWKSYDAALDGFDATHIALAVGSGHPDEADALMAQLPLLKIEKAGAVRAD